MARGVRCWTGVGAVVLVALAAGPGQAADPGGLTLAAMVRMSRAELEGLYRAGAVPAVPDGPTRGRAIPSPGTWKAVPASRLTWLLWRGKVFRPDGTMVNRVPWGRAVTADVSYGDSWLDGRPALVLDYAGTSRLFAAARDEVREVAPGLYLGLTYLRRDAGPPELAMVFTLDAR